jgi:MFS family permease
MKLLFRRDLNIIWWINIGILITYTVNGALLPLVLQSRGFGEGAIGFVVGMVALGSVTGFLASGQSIDRLDRRVFIMAGGLLWAVTSALVLFAASLAILAFLRLLQGIGYAILYTATLVYAAQALPAEWRGRMVGMIEAIGATAIAVTPLLAYPLAERFGTPSVLGLAGGISLLVALSAWLLPYQAPHPEAGQTATQLFASGAIVPGLLAVSLFSCATAFISLAPLLAISLGVQQIGLFLALRAFGTVPTRLFSGYLSDHVHPAWAIVPGFGLAAATLGLLPFTHQPILSLALAFLFGCGMGLASPAISAWMLQRVDVRQQAVALNTLYIFTEGSGFLGAWAFGLGLERFGLNSLYGLCLVTALGLAGYVVYSRIGGQTI